MFSEKIIVAIFSSIVGFSIPFFASVWLKLVRTHRILSALNRELLEIVKEIDKKLNWVSRDVTAHLNTVDIERIVKINGIHLYLGEREEFKINRVYWDVKYIEIAETVKDKIFSHYYSMYHLVESFEQKFKEMKKAFECPYGEKDKMALACFNDLKGIRKELEIKLSSKL